MLTADGFWQTDPAEMANALAAEAWASHAASGGSKGVWLYDWARTLRSGRSAPFFSRRNRHTVRASSGVVARAVKPNAV
jgi:hypothetical protein